MQQNIHITLASTMDEDEKDVDKQIEDLLGDEAKKRDEISDSLLLKIHRLEAELSTLDRRHGVKSKLQGILEEFVKQDDS